MKNNKVLLTAVGILTGASIIAITAFVALSNNSVYENYKNAVINFIELENYTLKYNFLLRKKDKIIIDSQQIINRNKEDSYNLFIEKVGDKEINHSTLIKGDKYIRYANNVIKHESTMEGRINSNGLFKLTDTEKKFINVLIDTILSDAKHSMVMDGNKIYGKLGEHQIPTIVQTAFIMYAEAKIEISDSEGIEKLEEFIGISLRNEEVYLDILNLMNMSIKRIEGYGETDEKGNARSLNLEAEIGGFNSLGEYEMIFLNFNIQAYDIGTTIVKKPF